MEDAIQRAARSRYGAENDIRAKIDPKSGDMRLWRVLEVVDQADDYFKQISLKDAQKKQADAAIGDFIVDPLPPIEFGRIAAQAMFEIIIRVISDHMFGKWWRLRQEIPLPIGICRYEKDQSELQ